MKLADSAPAYCAGCFQAGSDKRYVDFEAAYDGPVMEGVSHPVPIDDLVLCEQCLEAAFAKLDPKGQQDEIDKLTAELEAERAAHTSTKRQLSAAGVIKAERKRKKVTA